MNARIQIAFAVVATLVVGFAIAWGFVLAGSPAARRTQLFDDRRMEDLTTIARAIQAQVEDPNKKGKLKSPLPKTLEAAAAKARLEKLNTRDPETGEPYGYTVTDATTYSLCATFTRPRNADYRVFWNHPAGEHCFTINAADPPPF